MKQIRMTHWSVGIILAAAASLAVGASLPATNDTNSQDKAADLEFFEKSIRPILAENCYSCHSVAKGQSQSGLTLDSLDGLRKGGTRGTALNLVKPASSLILHAVGYDDKDLQMPPKGKLAAADIANLEQWVKNGAVWPKEAPPTPVKAAPVFNLKARRDSHWAWQTIKRAAIPTVKNKAWVKTPVDAFLLSKLEQAGLKPAAEAEKRVLIRRATYDLTGLPPTVKDVNDFLADKSPSAYEKLVDRLLASPHYGERWARHWMDLVRYAETDGHEFDFDKPGAFEYRDYLIRTFNSDVPYNQFIHEHLAGDLLSNPRIDPKTGVNESLVATGFWWLGEGKHSPVDLQVDLAEHIDNQVDVLSKAMLGLSMGCAKCHDHKFDAISTKDYYALCGYMKSSRFQLATTIDPSFVKPTTSKLEMVAKKLEASVMADQSLRVAQPTSYKEGSILLADFKGPGWDGWTVTGAAFGSGPSRVAVAPGAKPTDGPTILTTHPAADSGWLSDRLQGGLRSKDFTISTPRVWFHMAGRATEVNVIIDGFQRIRYPIYGGLRVDLQKLDKMAWHSIDFSKWIGHIAYIEILDPGQGRIVVDRVVFGDDMPEVNPSKLPANRTVSSDSPEASLLAERASIESALPDMPQMMAITDGDPVNDHVHLRGNTATLGDEVPRRFLEACNGLDQPASKTGSGRLDLAEKMTSTSNPLLARVMVNRIWQLHFTEGIVRSVDDFGAMGQKPTHPELLDWLASEFIRQGWSVKKMHKLMMLSSAYRMSSKIDAVAETKDPLNKLVHHMPIRRLEAEAIRDGILAVSGRLNEKMFGPSVMPYLTPFMEGRGRPGSSGPLDGDGRRTIYTSVRRNFLVPMLSAFDFPVPFSCIGKRSVSNVPAQALTLMNNPFVTQQAEFWAKRLLADNNLTDSGRVHAMYRSAFSREPDLKEEADALKFIASQKLLLDNDNLKAWTDLCHVMFNVKEFIFIP